MIKAFIFDFDGTIIDTESLWFAVCQDQFAKQGQTLTLSTYCQCIGASLAVYDPYRDLAARMGRPELAQELEAQARRDYAERSTALTLREGVLDLILAAKAGGLLLAVASSSDYEHVATYLQRFELLAHFATICTRNDVAKVKPAPDLFELALDRLGLVAAEAVVFEDSPNGLLAALAAGIRTVVVPNPLTNQLTFNPAAIKKVEAFTQIDMPGLIAELSLKN
jgi:putative hydrolase of the HAD superfamily